MKKLLVFALLVTGCVAPVKETKPETFDGEIERVYVKFDKGISNGITFTKLTIGESGKTICYGIEGRGMQSSNSFQINCGDVFGE
jgi:hypothetical protein